MSKYIIKNCPSYRDFDVFGLPNKGCCYNFNDYCSKHNECVLRQIVEKCKSVQQEEYTVKERDKLTGEVISIIAYKLNPNFDFAQEILDLLQIEEIK